MNKTIKRILQHQTLDFISSRINRGFIHSFREYTNSESLLTEMSIWPYNLELSWFKKSLKYKKVKYVKYNHYSKHEDYITYYSLRDNENNQRHLKSYSYAKASLSLLQYTVRYQFRGIGYDRT